MNVEPSRCFAMDGVRGIAILGILLMNITSFALPEAAYFNPLAVPAPAAADRWTWAVLFVLADGKMRGLFALLFGAGIWIGAKRAGGAGQDGQNAHIRRMGWLFAIGLAHFYFVWPGDILSLYAAVGLVAWFFVGASTAVLLRSAAALLLLAFLMTATLHGGTILPDMLTTEAIEAQYGLPDAATLEEEIAHFRSGYSAIFSERLHSLGFLPFWQIILTGPETLALMLLGMVGARTGFLTGAWARVRYLRIAALAYVLGLPAAAMLAASIWSSGFAADTIARLGIVAAMPVRLPILLGHAALMLWWLGGPANGMKRSLAAAGRLALSNYLLCSLIMTALFYGYGFGLFAKLNRTELLGIVMFAWVMMLSWSKWWLQRFCIGPFERAWRSLTSFRQ